MEAKVKNYTICIFSGQDIYATVKLNLDNNEAIYLDFYHDRNAMVENYVVANGMFRVKLHLSILQTLIDTLRNEKPLRVMYSPVEGFGGCFFLNTSEEPVGEAEGFSYIQNIIQRP